MGLSFLFRWVPWEKVSQKEPAPQVSTGPDLGEKQQIAGSPVPAISDGTQRSNETPSPLGPTTSPIPFGTPKQLVYPEWYDTAIIDVPKDTLDEGVSPVIGARTRELPKKGEALLVRVKFRNTRRCAIGDLDIINGDLQKPGSRLVMTLQQLQPSKQGRLNVSGAEVGLKALEGDGSVELMVPTSETPTVYGLFICTITGDQKVCGAGTRSNSGTDKNSAQVQDSDGEKRVQNPVRYFNPVVIHGDRLTAFKQPYKEDNYYETLGTFIKDKAPQPEGDTNSIDMIRKFNDVIRSGGLQLNGSEALIDLPRFDKSLCAEIMPTIPARDPSLRKSEEAGS